MENISNIEKILNKLALSHPRGISAWSTYYGERRNNCKLSFEEVKELFDFISDNREKFKELVLANTNCKLAINKFSDDLIYYYWFNHLLSFKALKENSLKQRIKRAELAAARRLKRQQEMEKRKVQRELELAKQKEAIKLKKQKLKEKAKKKVALWKQLNLSAEQKRLFKQLAK